MRVLLSVIAILVAACSHQPARPVLPPTFVALRLSAEQDVAIRDAAAPFLPEGVSVLETYGYKMFDGDNLRGMVFSSPVNIRAAAYDVHTIGCSYWDSQLRGPTAPDYHPVWHCAQAEDIANVYLGSLEKNLWLAQAVEERDALAILEDAMAICDLNFDVPYTHKPRLLPGSAAGQWKFSAPKCHYEYRINKGLPVRGKPFDPDTPAVGH